MPLAPGYTWRPLQLDDVDLMAALYARWEQHHELPFRTDRAEIEHDLGDPTARLEERSICALDAGGVMRGLGWVFQRTQEDAVPKQRAIVWVIGDPEHSDLEDGLIDWCDGRATVILEDFDDGLDKVLRAWSPGQIADRIARFERHGYHLARYFSSLTRPVAGTTAPAPPSGIDLVDWSEGDHGRAIHAAHIEAFKDHWGSVPADWGAWQRDAVGDSHSRLDLSVVAVAGDEVVGYSLNQIWPNDAEVRGLTEGYIAALGVSRDWRGRGIATALILESMCRFAAEGLDNATLDTDADSLTGAFELYRRLGFEVVDTNVTLIKEL